MKKIQKNNAASTFQSGSIIFLITSAIILPALALLPFAIRAKSNYFTVGSKLLGWTAQGPIQSPPTVGIGWSQPSSIDIISGIGVLVLVLLAALTIWYAARHSSYRGLKKLSTIHLLIAVAITMTTIVSYTTMRRSSQSNEAPVSSSQVYGLNTQKGVMACDEIVLPPQSGNGFSEKSVPCTNPNHVPGRIFGYGIAPAYLVLFCTLYLIAPLLNWYRYSLSSRYVGGQKKGTLFQ